jgi:hypothetical protein
MASSEHDVIGAIRYYLRPNIGAPNDGAVGDVLIIKRILECLGELEKISISAPSATVVLSVMTSVYWAGTTSAMRAFRAVGGFKLRFLATPVVRTQTTFAARANGPARIRCRTLQTPAALPPVVKPEF